MSAKAVRILALLGAVLVLGAVNFSIVQKERVKSRGAALYLALAPIDPRSLMQGDYMALRFEIASQIPAEQGGSAGLTLDARRVGTLAPAGTKPDLSIRYRIRNGQVWLGTNAYFFEEGRDRDFASARYGEFRVDPASGEAVLVGLADVEFRRL